MSLKNTYIIVDQFIFEYYFLSLDLQQFFFTHTHKKSSDVFS